MMKINDDDQGAGLIGANDTGHGDTLPRPNETAINAAIQMSTFSPCQSKRGAVIFAEHSDGTRLLGQGYNHKTKFECDGSDACKATCRQDAIHAEQMALIAAAKTGFAVGMEALHVKTVSGVLVASGGPTCVECSKLLRACGVAAVWLYHTHGWHRYAMDEFHALSLVGSAPDSLSEASTDTAQERSAEENTNKLPSEDDQARTVEQARNNLRLAFSNLVECAVNGSDAALDCHWGEVNKLTVALIAAVRAESVSPPLTLTENLKEQLERLHLIASGDRDCDMSENDLAALRAVLMTFDELLADPPVVLRSREQQKEG